MARLHVHSQQQPYVGRHVGVIGVRRAPRLGRVAAQLRALLRAVERLFTRAVDVGGFTRRSENVGKLRTIERSEGMQPVARVAAPPVRHVRPRVELGEFPDGYDRNHYPTLTFVQEKVVIAYRSGVLPADQRVKLLAIPEQDIYR